MNTKSLAEERGLLLSLCQELTDKDGGGSVSWQHFLPWGETETVDFRGPFTLGEEQEAPVLAMFERAKARENGPLLIGYEHNEDNHWMAPLPGDTTASGWLTEMRVVAPGADLDESDPLSGKPAGAWGRVEWTEVAKNKIRGKELTRFSPVLLHDQDGNVWGIVGGSLTNRPNIPTLEKVAATRQKQPKEGETMGDDAWKKHAKLIGSQAESEAEFTAELVQLQASAQTASTEAEAKLKEVEDRATAAELKLATNAAETAVDTAISEGRLPSEAREHWIKQAVEQPEMFAATLAVIPEGAIPVPVEKAAPPQGEHAFRGDAKQRDGDASIISFTSAMPGNCHVGGDDRRDARLAAANSAIKELHDKKDDPQFANKLRLNYYKRLAGGA
jgi:phage I-like protein